MLTGGAIVEGITFGAGREGDIDLRARDVELSDGAIISARSTGDGAAGTLGLQVAETFRSESGHMTMAAVRAGGGTIALTAGRLVQLIDSELSTSVRGGGVTQVISPSRRRLSSAKAARSLPMPSVGGGAILGLEARSVWPIRPVK
jgi:hypothetical protein